MLFDTLRANLLGNLFTGNGITRAGKETVREGESTITAS